MTGPTKTVEKLGWNVAVTGCAFLGRWIAPSDMISYGVAQRTILVFRVLIAVFYQDLARNM